MAAIWFYLEEGC